MKLARVKTESWHNYYEGDCGSPIENYFKKGLHKRVDRKKFIKNALKFDMKNQHDIMGYNIF